MVPGAVDSARAAIPPKRGRVPTSRMICILTTCILTTCKKAPCLVLMVAQFVGTTRWGSKQISLDGSKAQNRLLLSLGGGQCILSTKEMGAKPFWGTIHPPFLRSAGANVQTIRIVMAPLRWFWPTGYGLSSSRQRRPSRIHLGRIRFGFS
jgi:hypothetical protein